MRVTTPTVDSSVDSRWTLKRRSTRYEVTTLSKVERESLLDSVMGSENSVDIPADEVLAMKTDLSLTWSKLRVLRRFVKVMHKKK